MAEKDEIHEKQKELIISFFKKIWYSISKFEKYPEMASEGTPRALLYLMGIMLIFSVLVTSALLYHFHSMLQDKTQFEEYVNSSELAEKVNVEVLENEVKIKINDTNEEINYSFNEIYSIFLVTVFVSVFLLQYISVLMDTLLIVALGKITLMFIKMKIKFSAIYNMSIYALTISVFLNAIYNMINIITGFEMTYFYVMYISVAYVCLVAAIFLLRIELMKRQAEIMKLIEEQKKVKREMEEQKREREKKENKKPEKDNNKDEQEDDKSEDQVEPDGS